MQTICLFFFAATRAAFMLLACACLNVALAQDDEIRMLDFQTCLGRMGEKADFYYSVENFGFDESNHNTILNSFISEEHIEQISDVGDAMYFLTNTVQLVWNHGDATNRIQITAELYETQKPFIFIRDTRLDSVVGYALDDPLSIDYDGAPTDLVKRLSGIDKRIERINGIFMTGSGPHWYDGSTKISVKAVEKPIRNILTDCIPLEGYKRLVWNSCGDGSLTNPLLRVEYNGQDYHREARKAAAEKAAREKKEEEERNAADEARNAEEARLRSLWHRERFPEWRRPGDGWPGKASAYPAPPQLQGYLKRFDLSAGWYLRDELPEGYRHHPYEFTNNAIPYLLFTPKAIPDRREAVPMVVYFGGTGEQGTNLLDHFHQTTIFSKITSAEFQKRHPCYLLAPMLPKYESSVCFVVERPLAPADLICDAMYAVIRGARNPPVDTNRLYLTGLSHGGRVAFDLPAGYPGRFAASVPVSASCGVDMDENKKSSNYWLLRNAENTESAAIEYEDLAAAVRKSGGEFRFSTFPDKGHNAWDKAWQEDAVWDWMFSKTADGKAAPTPRPAMLLTGARCSASRPGRDKASGPERAADGLDATCYVSAAPMKRGDWWRVEFPSPVAGRITLAFGFRDGKGLDSYGRIEVSADGERWERAGAFSGKRGAEESVSPRSPVKHLRVLPDSPKGETLVIREVRAWD